MIQTLLGLMTPPITFCDQAPAGVPRVERAEPAVLIRADVRQLMVLTEAVRGEGIGSRRPTLGRPSCAALPESIEGSHAASRVGCVGHRGYTGAADQEGHFAVPGTQLATLESRLQAV